jgi:hypothetical protein
VPQAKGKAERCPEIVIDILSRYKCLIEFEAAIRSKEDLEAKIHWRRDTKVEPNGYTPGMIEWIA